MRSQSATARSPARLPASWGSRREPAPDASPLSGALQRAAALAAGGDGIPRRIESAGPHERGGAGTRSARGGAQGVWEYDKTVGRRARYVGRTVGKRCGAGSETDLSRHAARYRLHHVRHSYSGPWHRRQFHHFQRGERLAAASTADREPAAAGMDREQRIQYTGQRISGFAGAEPVVFRSGRLRGSARRFHDSERRRRIRASDQRSRDAELLHTARSEAHGGKIVHAGGMPGQSEQSVCRDPELRLLAEALRRGSRGRRADSDAQQQARHGHWGTAAIVRFREPLRARPIGGSLSALASHRRDGPFWKYDVGDRTALAWRDRTGCSGCFFCFWVVVWCGVFGSVWCFFVAVCFF